ncbi:hypothetical protein PHSY_006394 [Pseudozyma hubeiensis SY62]|uniref:Cas12f1-like TNB domain-containing protein n=1 Tax=Pseudozyma hubeiensis (strain SY62) TaxID=1305764 RepID=R9PBS5_PSEHS|nr:hypothetical protein PHSY_006394 [Pseudozyma hubeiensis SY62]GAC98799.1 hypothetical protein PHSY_006394 [Pseudozyma hubeiensis SY62]
MLADVQADEDGEVSGGVLAERSAKRSADNALIRPLPGPRRDAHRRPPPPVPARQPRPPPPPLPPPPPVARAPPRPGRRNRSVPFALSAKRRRRLDRQARAIRYKMSNLVTDLHCRVAHHMALTSDVIVMPRMEVRNMIRRRGARLHRNTKRRLMAWGHCAFLNRLSIKCRDIGTDQRYEKRQTVLLVQPEPYTSNTCGQCGHLNDRLGSSRTFACSDPECQYVADRDRNGAYNMAVRAICSARVANPVAAKLSDLSNKRVLNFFPTFGINIIYDIRPAWNPTVHAA